VAVDGDNDIFITGTGGLYVLEGSPLEDVPFSSNGNAEQFSSAIAFDPGLTAFEPFAGRHGGRLAFMADYGYQMEDKFITVITPAEPEDFNSNGAVNAEDLATWTSHFGSMGAEIQDGDADADGDVDGHDFLRWQRALALPSSPPEVGAGVPEPACGVLSITVALAGFCHATRAGRRVMRR
jgi:hypothetical protein